MGFKKRKRHDMGPPYSSEEVGYGLSPSLWATNGGAADYVFPSTCRKCNAAIVVPKAYQADVEAGKRIPLCPKCLLRHVSASTKGGTWKQDNTPPSPEFIAFVNKTLKDGPPRLRAQNN